VNELHLERAVVLARAGLTGPESKAVEMLVDEVARRSQIRWPVLHSAPDEAVPVILVGTGASFHGLTGRYAPGPRVALPPQAPEGYSIALSGEGEAPAVFVTGADARGVLFGVGGLLRALRMRRGSIALPTRLRVSTAPAYPLRGHQLGYRPKTNSYDGWDLWQWEQYFRDLAVFGTNAVELIPPRSDDAPDSPHFPLPPLETMVGMSRLADDYGLDVWIWYPAMDRDYTDPDTAALALREWAEVFRSLPRVDAVFVPGGDPGHTPPGVLLSLLEKQADNLRRHHPAAGMWVSPQGFTAEWLEEFLRILREEQPGWLGGVVHGPQVRIGLAELRAAVPERYPVRSYPDITHSLRCQFPVPDWDPAFALTEGREGINPRPLGFAHVFRRLQPYAQGFITYSEGCNDDVNKIVWSALGWDPDADVTEILRDYSRYFIGPDFTEPFAQGLLALERNWQGPLLLNEGVYTTLAQFQALERDAPPRVKLSWRFQQALYRAYYDAYLRSRLLHETALEERALEALRGAKATGSLPVLARAEEILGGSAGRPSPDWRARVFELAEALFQSIRMQLSVERYAAIAVERGANLDSMDEPLNDAPWLRRRFAEIRAIAEESDRLAGIRAILQWTDPGPGGFYDDLGHPTCAPHLVRGPDLETAPAMLYSTRTATTSIPEARLSWRRCAETVYDTPLRMRYDHLDPGATYRLRVVYAGDTPRAKTRLEAGDGTEIHPFLPKPSPIRPLEFDLPSHVTSAGTLDLAWHGEPGRGGNGRGCQVAEVWLIRTTD
jgi:hypothetical protein